MLFSSYALSYTWDRPFLTTNRFVLLQNPIDSNPYLQLSNTSKHIELKKDQSLRDIEKQLLTNREAQNSVTFIAPDGAFISKSTSVHHLLHLPYFVLKIDSHREFNVMSAKSFSLRNQKFTLNANEKLVFDGCKSVLNMRDQNAVECARFVSQFQEELLGDQKEGGVGNKKEWTQNEVMILAREVLAEKASSAKEEKEILEH